MSPFRRLSSAVVRLSRMKLISFPLTSISGGVAFAADREEAARGSGRCVR